MKNNIDIVKPVNPPARIDWDAVFDQFVLQEETPYVQTFLRDVLGWSEKRILSGTTTKHTVEWGNKRAIKRQELSNEKFQYAKTQFEELMPAIQSAKRDIILGYLELLQKGHFHKDTVSKWKKVTLKNGKKVDREYKELVEWYTPLSMREKSHILTKLKTELGEAAVITKQNVEDVSERKDPALSVLIAMGIINQDGGTTRTAAEAKTTDGKTPTDLA